MMNKVNRLFLFVVLVISFAGTTKFIHNKIMTLNADTIVLRFAVTSGTYVQEDDAEFLVRYIESVQNYAASQENPRLDALIVNGNLTDDGSPQAWEYVSEVVDTMLSEDTDPRFYFTVGGSDFMVTEEEADGASLDPYFYEKVEDHTFLLQGYRFILMSPVFTAYESKMDWLNRQLEQYAKYDIRPVFVIQPGTIQNTYYGSEQWYEVESAALKNTLDQYANVIDFSGSAATPAHIGKSVVKTNALYVNNGNVYRNRLKLEEFGYDTSEDFFNEAIVALSQCKIVEVYGDGRTQILTMNLSTGEIYGGDFSKYFMNPQANGAGHEAMEKNEDKTPPFFEKNVKIHVYTKPDDVTGVTVEFSPAKDEEGVLLYRIVLKDNAGKQLKEYIRYSDYAVGKEETMQNYSLPDFDHNAVLIQIVPVDYSGNCGDGIQSEIKSEIK